MQISQHPWATNRIEQFYLSLAWVLHLFEDLMPQQFPCGGSVAHPDIQTPFDQLCQFFGISGWYGVVIAKSDLSAQPWEVLGEEGRSECGQFVQEAAGGPNIHSSVIFGVVPYLGAGVIGGACLGGGVFPVQNFRDVEISDFGCPSYEENIGRFDVPMDDVVGVEDLESFQDIEGYLPYEIFAEFMMFFILLFYEALGDGKVTARSPPSAYSMSMQSVLPNSSMKALLYDMILGESMEARRRTSLSALSFYLALSCIILICFIAKTSLSDLPLRTFMTRPKLPEPSYFKNSNQCIMEEYGLFLFGYTYTCT